MADPLVEYLRQCCLRVLGDRPGCGFFIAPQLVVTCAHVVGREVEVGTELELHKWGLEGTQPLTGEVIGIFPDDDIAFLETATANSAFAPLSAEARSGHDLKALGFPKQEERTEFDEISATYEGRTLFIDESGRRGVEEKFKAGQVEPGYSGGPLLNLDTGRVMGVVVATREECSDLGGWAIEVPVIERLLKECDQEIPPIDIGWKKCERKAYLDNIPIQFISWLSIFIICIIPVMLIYYDYVHIHNHQIVRDRLLTPKESVVEITRILIDPDYTEGYINKSISKLDFRAKNRGEDQIMIDQIAFEVIDKEAEIVPVHNNSFYQLKPYSAKYDLDLKNLEIGDVRRVNTAQLIKPGEIDRFSVTISDRTLQDNKGFETWILRPRVLTSEGIIVKNAIEIKLEKD